MIRASDALVCVVCLWSEMIRRLYMLGKMAESYFLLNVERVAKLSFLSIFSRPHIFLWAESLWGELLGV